MLLDFVLLRNGFGSVAQRLFEASVTNRVVYASGLSFSHIYYTMRKTNSASERLAALQNLAGLVEIIPVGRPIIEAALTPGFADSEDGLQYSATCTIPAITAIVTRDPRGFAAGALPVLSPPEALARLA